MTDTVTERAEDKQLLRSLLTGQPWGEALLPRLITRCIELDKYSNNSLGLSAEQRVYLQERRQELLTLLETLYAHAGLPNPIDEAREALYSKWSPRALALAQHLPDTTAPRRTQRADFRNRQGGSIA